MKNNKHKLHFKFRNAIFFALCLMFLITSNVWTQELDRTQPPQLGPPPKMKLPAIQRLELSNGLKVVLMEKHQVPLVQINLLIKAGSAMESSDKSGLASMTAAMLDEGAGSRNALELADAIDFLGANISTSSGRHTSGVFLQTPLSKFDSALPLFADVALYPTFPEEELERQRKQRLTTLLQRHDEARAIASVIFDRTLYGTKHPYGIPTIGDEESLRSFRVEDLRTYHDTYFRPNNATLIVVGDVTAQLVLPKLEAAFGEWKRGDIPKASWAKVKQVKKRQVYIVDKPGAAQSEIRIGRIGVPRLTEDYYALRVMNTILGGSFASRLNQNLREEHGYTYGARSSFNFRPLPGPFLASAAVQTDVTDKSLVEFMKELNGILKPVSDEEITRAKNFVALRFPENFQTVSNIARQLTQMVTYDLTDDYFNNYVERILAVTKKDVQRVAKKYIDPKKMAVIVVGDREKIEKGVRDLKLGTINLMTIEDVLGEPPIVEGTN